MHRIEVPYISQSGRYPTGCESVSAVMLLWYLGYQIPVDTFIEEHLEMQEIRQIEGRLYGPDPNCSFAGSPYEESSFGCYAPVICKALEKVLGNEYDVINETGKTLQELSELYLDAGMPVIVWACINMREPVEGPEWTLMDTGEPFTWISNEHCMLLVGYDETHYYFNDPYENNGVIGYEKAVTQDRYAAQHMQAVGIRKK